jgi:hypothetical protein
MASLNGISDTAAASADVGRVTWPAAGERSACSMSLKAGFGDVGGGKGRWNGRGTGAGWGKGNVCPTKTGWEVGVTFGSVPKPANLRFRAAGLMAPSNPFKQFCPSIGGSFSPRTVKWRLFYRFGLFKGTSRDALTLHVLSIRPSLVEGLKCLERSRFGSPRHRPIAKFFLWLGVWKRCWMGGSPLPTSHPTLGDLLFL